MEILHLDPLLAHLDELTIGSLIMTNRNIYLKIGQILSQDKFINCYRLYMVVMEKNYHLSNENIYDKMIKLLDGKLDLFCRSISLLYDNIYHILDKYNNDITWNVIYLVEFYNNLSMYANLFSNRSKYSTINSKDNHQIIPQYFSGCSNFGRRSLCDLARHGICIDFFTINIELPDLQSSDKTYQCQYKKYWDLNFFKECTVNCGYYDICNLLYGKHKNIFTGIVNNQINFTINLSDINICDSIITWDNPNEINFKPMKDKTININNITDAMTIYGGNLEKINGLFMENNYTRIYLLCSFNTIDTILNNQNLPSDFTGIDINDVTIFANYKLIGNKYPKRYNTYIHDTVCDFLFQIENPIAGKSYEISATVDIINIHQLDLKINNKIYHDYSYSLNDNIITIMLPDNIDIVSAMVICRYHVMFFQSELCYGATNYISEMTLKKIN